MPVTSPDRPLRSVEDPAGRDPARESAVIDAFVDLSHDLTTETDVSEMLARLVERCVDLLTATAAGILLPDTGGQLAVLAASSSRQRVLEAFQLQAAQGPCLDCTRTGEPVLVGDLEAEHATSDRWPVWSPRALSDGIRSVYAVPMRLRGRTVGALNLLGDRTELVDARNYRLVAGLADVATLAVFSTRQTLGQDQQVAQLEHALTARILIEQAKGVVATALGTTMDDAFQLLRAHSRSNNRRLTDICTDITTGRLGSDELQVRTR